MKAGARMLVWGCGKIYGTVGGGAFEKAVINQAKEVKYHQCPQLYQHHLTKDHDMYCGGTVTVYVEPIPIPYQLYIFGAGHISKALCAHAIQLDFEITVIDDRKNIFNDWKFPNVHFINKNPAETIPDLTWDKRTMVLIITYSHLLDGQILAQAIKLPVCYTGMIGSKRKAAIIRKLFLQNSASAEELDKVDLPVGINIDAVTPQELAISIIARLIQVKNKEKHFMKNGKWEMENGRDLAGIKKTIRGI